MEEFLKQFPEHPEIISYASRLFDIDTIKDLCTLAEYQAKSGFSPEDTFQKAARLAARIEEDYDEVHDDYTQDDEEITDNQPQEVHPKRYTNHQAEAYALIAEYQAKSGIDPSETFSAIENEAEDASRSETITLLLASTYARCGMYEKAEKELDKIRGYSFYVNDDKDRFNDTIIQISKEKYRQGNSLNEIAEYNSLWNLSADYESVRNKKMLNSDGAIEDTTELRFGSSLDYDFMREAQLYVNIAEIAIKQDNQEDIPLILDRSENLARICASTFEWEKSKKLVELFQKLSGTNFSVGNLQKSASFLERAVKLVPSTIYNSNLERVQALRDLALTLHEYEFDTAPAIEEAEKIIERTETAGSRFDQRLALAEVQFGIGTDRETVRTVIENAKKSHNAEMSLDDTMEADLSQEDYFNLGITQIRTGDISEGLKNIQKAKEKLNVSGDPRSQTEYFDSYQYVNFSYKGFLEVVKAIQNKRFSDGELQTLTFEDIKGIFDMPNPEAQIEVGFLGLNQRMDLSNQVEEMKPPVEVSMLLGEIERLDDELLHVENDQQGDMQKQRQVLLARMRGLIQTEMSPTVTKRFVEGLILTQPYEMVSNQLLDILRVNSDREGIQRRSELRILKGLIEIDNPKGKAIATKLFTDESLEPRYREYIAKKLFTSEYWDPKLGNYLQGQFRDKSQHEITELKKNQSDILGVMINEFGLTPDITAFQAFENVGLLQSPTLEGRVQEVKNMVAIFEGKSRDEIIDLLTGDVRLAKAYYILKAGESNYAIATDYSFDKFSTIIKRIKSLEVNQEVLDSFQQTLLNSGLSEADAAQVIEDLQNGRPLVTGEQRSFKFSTSMELGSQSDMALKQLNNSWNTELQSLLIARSLDKNPANMAESVSVLQDTPQIEARLQRLLQTLKIGSQTIDLRTIQGVSKELRNRLKAKYKDDKSEAARVRDSSDEDVIKEYLKDYLPTDERGELSPAATEWFSHFSDSVDTLKSAAMSKGLKGKSEEVEVTFLDKNIDFMRAIRFPDSAQCCFNSSNDNFNQRTYEYVTRLNKDPLSFMLDVRKPGSKDIFGFVFGRMGIDPQTGRPDIMLNGLYSQRKSPAMVENILKLVEEQMGARLKAEYVTIASKYGGLIKQPKGYEARSLEIEAVRAITGKNGEPEEAVYDDIGTIANGTFTFESGYVKNISQQE